MEVNAVSRSKQHKEQETQPSGRKVATSELTSHQLAVQAPLLVGPGLPLQSAPTAISQLQRSIGNQAVQRIARMGTVVQRRKLTDSEIKEEVAWALRGEGASSSNSTTLLREIMATRAARKEGVEDPLSKTLKQLRDILSGEMDKDDEKAIKETVAALRRKGEIQSLDQAERPKPPYKNDVDRQASFDRTDPTTWELNPVRFLNGLDSSLDGAVDADPKIGELGRAQLSGNSKAKGKKLSIIPDTAFHAHLSAGSWGLAFIYRLEDDYKITPCAFDIATSRLDNKYKWKNSTTGYNSSASTDG